MAVFQAAGPGASPGIPANRPPKALADELPPLKRRKPAQYRTGALRLGRLRRPRSVQARDILRAASPRPRSKRSRDLSGLRKPFPRFRGATSRRGRLKSGRVEVQVLPEPLRPRAAPLSAGTTESAPLRGAPLGGSASSWIRGATADAPGSEPGVCGFESHRVHFDSAPLRGAALSAGTGVRRGGEVW